MGIEKKTHKHDSYGQISLGRTSGGSRFLYGSSIKHEHTIKLDIYTSERIRRLNNDQYHKKIKLVELEISPTQFSELVMSRDNYEGIPCTLRYTQDKGRIYPPVIKGTIEEFENEFQNHMSSLSDELETYSKRCEEILERKGAVKKAEKVEILDMIRRIHQEMNSNIPYVYKCFNEQMDKSIVEAKGEVEAFVESKLRSVGLDHTSKEILIDNRNTDNKIELECSDNE